MENIIVAFNDNILYEHIFWIIFFLTTNKWKFLPISDKTFFSFSILREMRTRFMSLLASSLTYSFKMPSVLPVTTVGVEGSVQAAGSPLQDPKSCVYTLFV